MGNINKIFKLFENITGKVININQYKDRLRLQKLTYILKKMGMKIDYDFNWYVRGPYSPGLTKDAFNASHEEIALSSEEKVLGKEVKYLLSETDNSAFELIASIIYLIKERKIRQSNFKEIFDTIHISKPWYTEEQVKDALDKIIKSKFFE